MKRIVWFVLFLIIGVSCLDQPDCFRQDINLIGISFRKMLDGRPDTIRSIEVFADGARFGFKDTIPSTNIVLPLNYLSKTNQTNYTITVTTNTGEERTYNLKVGYQSKAQFVSVDCGERYVITDLTIPDYIPGQPLATIDSIRLVSSAPANPAGTNIQLFRCPRLNVMRLSFRQLYMNFDSLGKADNRILTDITSDYIKPVVDSTTGGLTNAALLTLNPVGGQTNFTFKFKGDKNVVHDSVVSFGYTSRDSSYFVTCPVKLISGLHTVNNPFKHLKIATQTLHDPPYTNAIVFNCATTNTVRVNFKHQSGSATPPQTIDIANLQKDGVSILKDTAVTSVVLPLNGDVNRTVFTFQTKAGPVNTLTLNYTTQVITYQKVCGPQTLFTALQATIAGGDFLSSTIISSDVKFPTTDNVQILLP